MVHRWRIAVPFVTLSFSGLAGQDLPEWQATETLRIGGMDGTVYLSFVRDLAVSDSLVYVAQSQAGAVRVFTFEGVRRPSIGRQGQGPGEFGSISALALLEDTLVVVDPSQSRMTFLAADGELLRTERIPSVRGDPPISFIGAKYPASGGFVVSMSATAFDKVHLVDSLPVVITGPDGSVVDTLPAYHHRGSQRDIAGVVFAAPVNRRTRASMSTNGRYFASADGFDDRVVVRIYDTRARSLESIELPLTARPVPRAYRDSVSRSYHENMAHVMADITPRRFAEQLDLPERAIGVDMLQVMDDGAIWLAEPSFGGAERVWQVVAADGDRKVVRTSGEVVVLDVRDDDVWGRAMDEYNVHYVVRLRLDPIQR